VQKATMKKIDISIIIATRNRENILLESVEKAVAAIDGMAVEIIVVNDGDQPIQIPQLLKNKIICIDNPSRGVSSARNFGVAKSVGEILFFLDDDMWISSDAITWIINHFTDNENAKQVYNLNWEYPPSLKEKLLKVKVGKYLLSAQYNTLWGRMHEPGERPVNGLYPFHHIGSGSLVMHKDIFSRLGGYNQSLIFQGEDNDLSSRINKLGIPIYCVFDITLMHNQADRLDLDGYLQRLGNGYKSQFMAENSGAITASPNPFKKSAIHIFEIFRVSEKAWIGFYKLIPNHKIFTSISNRLTGLLSGLQRYKQWKNNIGNEK